MIKLTILGGSGRMGHAVKESVRSFADLKIIASPTRGDDLERAINLCDVVLDFSGPELSLTAIRIASLALKPCVIGTTGFSQKQEDEIRQASEKIPIVKTANFSLGIAVVAHISGLITRLLGNSYDVEIIEMHHRGKRDAPSGTALLLAQEIAAARNEQLSEVAANGRVGLTGPRKQSEIGIHAVRGGDVTGEHTIIFADVGERVEVTHKASSRVCFATGALKASHWIHFKPPGLYGINHVLGIC